MPESHTRSEKIIKQANNEDTLTIIAVGTPEEIRSETDFDKASNVIEQCRPRYFSENIAARDSFSYTGRKQQASHTVYNQLPAGENNAENVTSVTESWTYYPDGREVLRTELLSCNIA